MGNCQGTQSPKAGVSKLLIRGTKLIVASDFHLRDQQDFWKVEEASRYFCDQNQLSHNYAFAISRIISYRQEALLSNVLSHLKRSEWNGFLDDLVTIDHDFTDLVRHSLLASISMPKVSRTQKTPKSFAKFNMASEIIREVNKRGEELLRRGEVCSVLICLESTSIVYSKGQSLGRIACHQAVSSFLLRQDEFMTAPVVIACSSESFPIISDYLKSQNNFGYTQSKLTMIVLQTLPVLDLMGNYCLTSDFRIMRHHQGTAYIIDELCKSHNNEFLCVNKVKLLRFCYAYDESNMLNTRFQIGFADYSDEKVCFYSTKRSNSTNQSAYVSTESNTYLKSNQSPIQEQQQVQLTAINQQFPKATQNIVINITLLDSLFSNFNKCLKWVQGKRPLQLSKCGLNTKTLKSELIKCYSFGRDMRQMCQQSQESCLVLIQGSIEIRDLPLERPNSKFQGHLLNKGSSKSFY